MLILGIGAFKPNISTQVGALYAPGDGRRDRAYSIFYVGINIGAFLAPLVCGTLAVAFGWHYGFAAAGVGMLISLGIYLAGQRTLPPDDLPRAEAAAARRSPLDPQERRNVLALLGICALVTLFWAAFDQQGNTILLWAEDFTDRTVNLCGLARARFRRLVPGAQSADDLRVHAAPGPAVDACRRAARTRAARAAQDGVRLSLRRGGLSG